MVTVQWLEVSVSSGQLQRCQHLSPDVLIGLHAPPAVAAPAVVAGVTKVLGSGSLQMSSAVASSPPVGGSAEMVATSSTCADCAHRVDGQ